MLDAERKPKTRKGRQNSRGTDHNYLTGKVDHEGTHPVLNQKMQVLKSPNIHLPDDRTEKCTVHTVVNKSCREPFFTTETERLTQLRKIIADLNKPNRPKTLESNVSLVPQVTNKTMTAQATQTGSKNVETNSNEIKPTVETHSDTSRQKELGVKEQRYTLTQPDKTFAVKTEKQTKMVTTSCHDPTSTPLIMEGDEEKSLLNRTTKPESDFFKESKNQKTLVAADVYAEDERHKQLNVGIADIAVDVYAEDERPKQLNVKEHSETIKKSPEGETGVGEKSCKMHQEHKEDNPAEENPTLSAAMDIHIVEMEDCERNFEKEDEITHLREIMISNTELIEESLKNDKLAGVYAEDERPKQLNVSEDKRRADDITDDWSKTIRRIETQGTAQAEIRESRRKREYRQNFRPDQVIDQKMEDLENLNEEWKQQLFNPTQQILSEPSSVEESLKHGEQKTSHNRITDNDKHNGINGENLQHLSDEAFLTIKNSHGNFQRSILVTYLLLDLMVLFLNFIMPSPMVSGESFGMVLLIELFTIIIFSQGHDISILLNKLFFKFRHVFNAIYRNLVLTSYDREQIERDKRREQIRINQAVKPMILQQEVAARINEMKYQRLPHTIQKKKYSQKAADFAKSTLQKSWGGGESGDYAGNVNRPPALIYINDEHIQTPLMDDPNVGCKIMTTVLINDEIKARAQIDNGAQLSLMSKDCYMRLSETQTPIEHRPFEEITVKGLGGYLKVMQPPVLLQLQIGNMVMNHKFLVTEELKRIDLLLGFDLLKAKRLTISPQPNGEMVLSIRDKQDKPLTQVKMEVTRGMDKLRLEKDEHLEGGETRMIEVCINKLDVQCQGWLHNKPILAKNYKDKHVDSILQLPGEFIQQPKDNKLMLPVQLKGDQALTFPAGWIVASAVSLIMDDIFVTDEGTYRVNSLGTYETEPEHQTVTIETGQGPIIIDDETDRRVIDQEDHKAKPKERDKDDKEDENRKTKTFSFTPDPTSQGMNEELYEPSGFDFPNIQSDEFRKILENKDIPIRFRQPLVDFIKTSTPNVVSRSEWDIGETNIIQHDIPTTTEQPVHLKPYKLQDFRLQQLREAIAELIRIGVLKKGDSNYAFPVFWIPKKIEPGATAQRMRLIFDLRALNAISLRQNFPLGDITQLMSRVQGSKYFIALDVRHAYYSVKLTEEAKKKCSIITPEGVFNAQRLVFGLSGAPATFSNLMSTVLEGSPAIFYMDDILIHGKTDEELFETLKDVLTRLEKAGLKIIPSKAVFWATELSWLGSILNGQGKKPDEKKVQAIKNFTTLNSVKQTQSFLGMLAYQCSYIQNFSAVIAPLSDLIKKGQDFRMTPEAQQAFDHIKETITHRTMLYHPNFSEELYAASDASFIGAGGWLYQVDIYENTDEDRARAAKDWSLDDNWESSKLYKGEAGKGCPPPIHVQGENPTIILGDKNKASKKETTQTPNGENTSENETTKRDEKNPEDTTQQDRAPLEEVSKKKRSNKTKQKEVYVIKPVSFWSKKFSESQMRSWSSLEKEFSACLQLVIQFADYFQACKKAVYLCVDSQPLLWACKHSAGPAVKLIRWAYLFQTYCPANIIISHCSGPKLGTPDFLSRVWVVKKTTKNDIHPKQAVHITPTFTPGSIITFKDICTALDEDSTIVRKKEGQNAMLRTQLTDKNTQTQWDCNPQILTVGSMTCTTNIDQDLVNDILKIPTQEVNYLKLTIDELQRQLSQTNMRQEQQKDEFCIKIKAKIDPSTNRYENFYLFKDILYRLDSDKRGEQQGRRVVPMSLQPIVLALYHWRGHPGGQRLYYDIKDGYFWSKMDEHCNEFTKGCVLCNQHKVTHQGKPLLGHPIRPPTLNEEFQIDLVEGLPSSEGKSCFMTCVEKFSGFIVPILLTNKDSPEIGRLFEQQVITKYAPLRVSSDNAANLTSKHMRTKLNWYGIKTVPTTRYAPITHGLVEVKNRHLQTIVRILADQFKRPWTKCLHLGAMLLNSTNSPQLQGKSSYEIMHGVPPTWKDIIPDKLTEDEVLDPENYQKDIIQQRKLAFQAARRRFKLKDERNRKVPGRKIKMPPGTLLYLKDFRDIPKKKAKQRFWKMPTRVIKEYDTIVYHKSLTGKVFKDHKRNLKICTPREEKFFANLPTQLKAAIGETFNEKIWQEYADKGEIPTFLEDEETPTQPIAERTRQTNPDDWIDPDNKQLEDDDDINNPDEDRDVIHVTWTQDDDENQNETDNEKADQKEEEADSQTEEEPVASRTRQKRVTFALPIEESTKK